MLDGYVDTLHFDEAWLPHAAFHPFYGSFHSMGKKRPRPKDALVFATQSTHKLLAGISQASQVLVQDCADAQAGPPPLQRGLPDAHLHQPAVRDHRQLRRGRGDDGAARRHRAGRGEHRRVAGLPPRDAQGRRGVRRGLVVQGLGPGQAGRTRASASATTGCCSADDNWHGFGELADGLQPARPDQVHHRHAGAGPVRQVRQDRHPGEHRHQVPGRARRGGREDRACTRSSSCSRSASPRAAGTRC